MVLPLGGCFYSSDNPLWPVKSGEQLPLPAGTYSCEAHESSGATQKGTVEARQVLDGANLYYTINDGHIVYNASFHRVAGNDYVAAMNVDGAPDTMYVFVQIRGIEVRWVVEDMDMAKKLAKDYNVSTDGTKLAYVDAIAAQKFIVEVSKHLQDAPNYMSCTHA